MNRRMREAPEKHVDHLWTVEELDTLGMRDLKDIAHRLFDRWWSREESPGKRRRRRKKLYRHLAKELGITVAECHFSELDWEQLIHSILFLQERYQ